MNMDEIINYPIECFNSWDIPGIPQHILSLKIDMPIIPLRNINPPRMCNGTWLAVKKKMMLKVIEASILNSKSKGDDVLIPRLPVIPTDMPFKLNDCSFTFDLLFRLLSTKHKVSHFRCVDWILKIHDLHMENYMFAFSRVGNSTKLFIFPQDGGKIYILCIP